MDVNCKKKKKMHAQVLLRSFTRRCREQIYGNCQHFGGGGHGDDDDVDYVDDDDDDSMMLMIDDDDDDDDDDYVDDVDD
jgi:hypothetical protein